MFLWLWKYKIFICSSKYIDIEKGAFYNCKSLEKIELPKELSDLKDETFYNCSSLQSINIPDDVSILEKGAF